MIRSSLSAGAAHGFALVSAQKGVAFQSRAQVNGTSSNIAGGTAAAPRWVRLLRAGTRVTAFSSSDGASWKTIGSATIALGTTAYVGLAVTSHDPTAPTIAVVSHTTVTPLSLPSPQKDADIGPPPVAGSAKFSSGTYTVTGSGDDIWGQEDQFNFVYQPLSGDVDISARVASLQGSSSWVKAGVMIRDSLANDSRHALALISIGARQRVPTAHRCWRVLRQHRRSVDRPSGMDPSGAQRQPVHGVYLARRRDMEGDWHRHGADGRYGLRRPGGDEPRHDGGDRVDRPLQGLATWSGAEFAAGGQHHRARSRCVVHGTGEHRRHGQGVRPAKPPGPR